MPSHFIQFLRSVRIGKRITLMVCINALVAAVFFGIAWWALQRVDQSLEAMEQLRSQSTRVENISKKSMRLMLLARQLMDARIGGHTFSQITVFGNDLERIIHHEASLDPTMEEETTLLLQELNMFQDGAWELFSLQKKQSEEFRNILDLGETVGGYLAMVNANAWGTGYYEIMPELGKIGGWMAKLVASANRYYFSGEDSQDATDYVEALIDYLPPLARRSGNELRSRYLLQSAALLQEYRNGLLNLIEGKEREKKLAVTKLNEPQAQIQRIINGMLTTIAFNEREASSNFRNELRRVAVVGMGLIGILLLMSLLLSWAIGYSITAPLAVLHRAVRAQAAGRTVSVMPEGGDDELSALAGTVRKVGDLQAEKDQLIGDLRQAQDQVQKTLAQIRTLLDNSGQGVLSFGEDLIVDPAYSRESLLIFDRDDITGLPAPELLCPQDASARQRMITNLQRVCREEDAFRRDLLLSLMPKEVVLGEKVVEVQYRPLDAGKMMLLLTDITEERQLADAVQMESRRLALVVGAVTNREEMLDVMDDFRLFMEEVENGQLSSGGSGKTETGALAARAFRLIHTYKGLFALMDCIHLPLALQDAEDRLADICKSFESLEGGNAPDVESERRRVGEALTPHELLQALDDDLQVIRNTLGGEFLESRGEVILSEPRVQALLAFAREAGCILDGTENHKIQEGLRILRDLRHVELRRLLGRYPRMSLQLAERLEKEIVPFEIETHGESPLVDPLRLMPFVRSLVHVFRNAVDHGIETREQRLEVGKPEAGQVTCSVREDAAGSLFIEIQDDGMGLDLVALAARAREMGLAPETVEAGMREPEKLVFAQGLSTTAYQAAGEQQACEDGAGTDAKERRESVSGRGVGMAAVKVELDKLGGKVFIDNKPGFGVSFLFEIPRAVDGKGDAYGTQG